LLIPGENDSDGEIDAVSRWVTNNLGSDVPLHFTAFHPDWKTRDKPATPATTLSHWEGPGRLQDSLRARRLTASADRMG
jgi:pyruvate-formate lyase-activating enzyme